MSKNTALIVEDTDANRLFFERLLTQADFEIRSARNGREALKLTKGLQALSLAVIDMQIPDINGLELTLRLRKIYPDACLVVATMHDEHSLMRSAFEKGCDIFLVKPHGFIELFKRLTTSGPAGLRHGPALVIDRHGLREFRFASL